MDKKRTERYEKSAIPYMRKLLNIDDVNRRHTMGGSF